MELFRKYPPPPPVEKDPPRCVVSHPDAGGPCGRPAVGEVWDLSFCEPHGLEAEYAAMQEAEETVGRELQAFADAEAQRWPQNRHVLRALGRAEVPGLEGFRYDHREHDRLMGAAYPPESCRVDPETSGFDYDDEAAYAGEGPGDWWHASREMVVRFMREAESQGLAALLHDLELVRERATVQQMLADLDYERRYVAPRRAAREARESRRDPHATTLGRINARLSESIDLLETVPADAFADWRLVHQRIAEVGGLVVAEEGRRREAESPTEGAAGE